MERLAELFDDLHKSGRDHYGQGKECANVVALFAHLYNFKVCFNQGSATCKLWKFVLKILLVNLICTSEFSVLKTPASFQSMCC